MNHRQLTRKHMFGRVANFFYRSAPAFNTFIPLKTEILNFFSRYRAFEAVAQAQARNFTDLHAAKHRVWREWVNELASYCTLALGWARREQPDLLVQLVVKEARMVRMSQ